LKLGYHLHSTLAAMDTSVAIDGHLAVPRGQGESMFHMPEEADNGLATPCPGILAIAVRTAKPRKVITFHRNQFRDRSWPWAGCQIRSSKMASQVRFEFTRRTETRRV
jgi:hypothetical protein